MTTLLARLQATVAHASGVLILTLPIVHRRDLLLAVAAGGFGGRGGDHTLHVLEVAEVGQRGGDGGLGEAVGQS